MNQLKKIRLPHSFTVIAILTMAITLLLIPLQLFGAETGSRHEPMDLTTSHWNAYRFELPPVFGFLPQENQAQVPLL